MLLELSNITKRVKNGGTDKIILNNLDFKVEKGDTVAIKGKSGSGKSTLLNILGGLLDFEEGTMFFNDEDITRKSLNEMAYYRMKNIGFITQQFHLLDDRNVFHNVALPLQYSGLSKKEIKERVINILDKFKMSDYIYKSISNLSGGERQRIAIARALVKEPDIILADEPTGSLDLETEQEILEIFNQLQKEGMTLIIVTHDDTVASSCKYIYQLSNGSLSSIK